MSISISDWLTSGKILIFSSEAEAGCAAELIITRYDRKKFTASAGKGNPIFRFSSP
jgi:hypothetical protein